jgi:anti-anti-sigma factor
VQSAGESGIAEVVLDLSAVEFMDSTGLDALLRARQALQGRCVVMRVVAASPSVALLLDTTGTSALLRGQSLEAPPAAMAD